MKIWHFGTSACPQTVNGNDNTVWTIAKAQAMLGQEVSVIVDTPPEKDNYKIVEEMGLEMIYIPGNKYLYNTKTLKQLLYARSPELIHTHSVFIPKQASLARTLVKNNIPYIINSHGGVAPEVLQRGWIKKSLYSNILEKNRFYAAAGLIAVTPKEEEAISNFVPKYQGKMGWIFNPVEMEIDKIVSRKKSATKKLVFLGRYDVLCKGIDILIGMASFLPDIEFHLYGTEDQKTKKWLEKLQSNLPANVYFHKPVFGAEKTKVLAEATVYIQMSRWEAFGVSIAEAMCLGTPCAVANTLNIAPIFEQHDLGAVLPLEPRSAALRLSEFLNQPQQLHDWSIRAKAFAESEFNLNTVGLKYIKFYEEVLKDLHEKNYGF